MKKLLMAVFVTATLWSCDSKKAVADAANNPSSLDGSWELTYITGTRLAPDQLYRDRKPLLSFNVKESKVSGNTGCNSFTGMISSISPGEIRFDENMAMTKMFCEGEGESVFLENMKDVSRFSFSGDGNTLTLSDGSIDRIRLVRK